MVPDQLVSFLAASAGARSATVQAFDRLSGGAIQENWRLAVCFEGGPEDGARELVLRTDAPSGVAVSLSRAQEFAVLKVAARAGVTVPEPLWLCEDPAVLGKPFYVMRKVDGTAAGHLIVRPEGPGGDKDRLAERLGEEMARIHHVVPPSAELDFLATPEDSPALWAVAEARRHLDDLGRPQPALEWGLRWCELHAPSRADLCLVHQDFRTGNYMVDDEGLTGILDWEFCAWGDPMSDVGWFTAKCWRFGAVDKEAGGIAGRNAFARGYERVSGRGLDPELIYFWQVMAHIRWAVIALQQGDRFLSGGEKSLDLALTGRIRPVEQELEILRLTAPGHWSEGARSGRASSCAGKLVTDQPNGAALLHEARRTLREELLPKLAEGDKLTGLLIANAIAIGARELEASSSDENDSAAADRLASELRAGTRDPDPILHESLIEDCVARLRISNPKVLR